MTSIFFTVFIPWSLQIRSNQAEIFQDVGDYLDKKKHENFSRIVQSLAVSCVFNVRTFKKIHFLFHIFFSVVLCVKLKHLWHILIFQIYFWGITSWNVASFFNEGWLFSSCGRALLLSWGHPKERASVLMGGGVQKK